MKTIRVKDGDTVHWSPDMVRVIHLDGTETIYHESIIKQICQSLKSTIQKFRFPTKGTKNGGQPNRSVLKVIK